MADDDGGFQLHPPVLGSSLAPSPFHLDPDLQLQLQMPYIPGVSGVPPVAPGLLGPGGGSASALTSLYGHYTDPPGALSPSVLAPLPPALPTPSLNPLDRILPRGLELDENGIGTTQGDWQMRFMPIIPGLNEPDFPAPGGGH